MTSISSLSSSSSPSSSSSSSLLLLLLLLLLGTLGAVRAQSTDDSTTTTSTDDGPRAESGLERFALETHVAGNFIANGELLLGNASLANWTFTSSDDVDEGAFARVPVGDASLLAAAARDSSSQLRMTLGGGFVWLADDRRSIKYYEPPTATRRAPRVHGVVGGIGGVISRRLAPIAAGAWAAEWNMPRRRDDGTLSPRPALDAPGELYLETSGSVVALCGEFDWLGDPDLLDAAGQLPVVAPGFVHPDAPGVRITREKTLMMFDLSRGVDAGSWRLVWPRNYTLEPTADGEFAARTYPEITGNIECSTLQGVGERGDFFIDNKPPQLPPRSSVVAVAERFDASATAAAKEALLAEMTSLYATPPSTTSFWYTFSEGTDACCEFRSRADGELVCVDCGWQAIDAGVARGPEDAYRVHVRGSQMYRVVRKVASATTLPRLELQRRTFSRTAGDTPVVLVQQELSPETMFAAKGKHLALLREYEINSRDDLYATFTTQRPWLNGQHVHLYLAPAFTEHTFDRFLPPGSAPDLRSPSEDFTLHYNAFTDTLFVANVGWLVHSKVLPSDVELVGDELRDNQLDAIESRTYDEYWTERVNFVAGYNDQLKQFAQLAGGGVVGAERVVQSGPMLLFLGRDMHAAYARRVRSLLSLREAAGDASLETINAAPPEQRWFGSSLLPWGVDDDAKLQRIGTLTFAQRITQRLSERLIVAGDFRTINSAPVYSVALVNGTHIFNLDSGLRLSPISNDNSESTAAATTHNDRWRSWRTPGRVHRAYFDTSSEWLYLAGEFAWCGNTACANVVRYSTRIEEWDALDGGTDGVVRDVVELDSRYLVFAGDFARVADVLVNHVAVFDRDSRNWTALAAGVDAPVQRVFKFHGRLLVVGAHSAASGVSAPFVAAWQQRSSPPYGEWSYTRATLDERDSRLHTCASPGTCELGAPPVSDAARRESFLNNLQVHMRDGVLFMAIDGRLWTYDNAILRRVSGAPSDVGRGALALQPLPDTDVMVLGARRNAQLRQSQRTGKFAVIARDEFELSVDALNGDTRSVYFFPQRANQNAGVRVAPSAMLVAVVVAALCAMLL